MAVCIVNDYLFIYFNFWEIQKFKVWNFHVPYPLHSPTPTQMCPLIEIWNLQFRENVAAWVCFYDRKDMFKAFLEKVLRLKEVCCYDLLLTIGHHVSFIQLWKLYNLMSIGVCLQEFSHSFLFFWSQGYRRQNIYKYCYYFLNNFYNAWLFGVYASWLSITRFTLTNLVANHAP